MRSIEVRIAPTRLAHVSLLVALAFLAARSTTSAAEPTAEKKKVTYSAGQKAAVDPETKKLRAPSREESDALDAQAKPADVPTVTPTALAGGGLKADLPEDYMDASVVQKNPDGTLTVSCVRGAAAADALVRKESKEKAPPSPTDKRVNNPAELEKE
jgi:hypothetical protein